MSSVSGRAAARVSVIVPTYNYGHFVERALDSIRSQEYPNVETIVVDDGSTDDTPQRLGPRADIAYIRQENLGLCAARNRGLSAASGDYVLFLDADDLLAPGSIRRRVEALHRSPSLPFVLCRSALFRRIVLPAGLTGLYREWRHPIQQAVDLGLCYFNIGPPHAFLTRRSVIEQAELRFDVSLRACEDYDFWLRVASAAGLPGLVDDCWVLYRRHPLSMSKSYENQYRHDAELCRRVLGLFDRKPAWMQNRPPLEYLAAILAGAAITARRLWYVDPTSFQSFVADHLVAVLERLEAADRPKAIAAEAAVYVGRARSTLLGMALHDGTLDRGLAYRFLEALDCRKRFFLADVRLARSKVVSRTTAALLRHDLIYLRYGIFNGL